METKEELVVFVKEMLQQRPSRQMLKIYMIGSTLALLGAIAGLVESVFAPGEEQHAAERRPEQGRLRDGGKGQGTVTAVRTEEEEEEAAALGQRTVPEEAKEDDLWRDLRRSSANRLHAS